LILCRPDGRETALTPDDLARLPQTVVAACMIASTGHPASGPFTFSGVRLADLFAAQEIAAWQFADVVSGDGFGTRVHAPEAQTAAPPILLATSIDGAPLRRDQGLVRLIVPAETGDALRQVKWVARIEVH
jgi:DMSO/TMAO reductase YedYZ molybdopterin-dependent catalytic subunit